MKKACLIVTIILLAVLMAGCENFSDQPETGSNVVGYTDDGRAIVELELGVGLGDDSRALHPTLAAAAADFYEVIFFDNTGGGKYYRKSWKEGQIARLPIPAGNYTGGTTGTPSYAYIFAGRYDDMMLLGVGKLTKVNGSPGTTVDGTTTRVDFEVIALATDVNDGSAPTFTSRPSTFAVTGGRIDSIIVNDVPAIPVFLVGKNLNSTGGPGGTDNRAPATFGFTFKNKDETTPANAAELAGKIIYDLTAAATTPPKFTTKPYAWPNSVWDNPRDLDTRSPEGLIFTGLPTAVNQVLPNPIGLKIATLDDDTKGKGGLCLLGIEVPVLLATNAAADNSEAARKWFFKGGLNNSLIDIGYDYLGMGGAVVIGSGNVMSGSGIVVGKE